MSNGIDISSNNHDGTILNFGDVNNAGFKYVWVKATQGNNYLNPYLIGDVRDAFHNGCEVGVYHFYDTVHGTPQQQADWFVRNGIAQVAEWCTLLPVLDFEDSNGQQPTAPERDTFLESMGAPTGVYMYRSMQQTMGYGARAAYGWLAWPGWTNEKLPLGTAVVQTGQASVPGIPKQTDVDTVVNATAITVEQQPITPEEIESMNPQYVELSNGDLVALVVTPQNHLVEVWRKSGTAGTAPVLPDFSYQDITAASNGGLTAAT
jgi:lysozyme